MIILLFRTLNVTSSCDDVYINCLHVKNIIMIIIIITM